MLPDEGTISAMHNTLRTVPVPRDGGFVPEWGENFNCRVWVKMALDNLESERLLTFTSVDDLEQETLRNAIGASSIGKRRLDLSKYTRNAGEYQII